MEAIFISYLLQCKNISVAFQEGDRPHVVLHHISLAFPSHGFYCLHGKSGSGKSTLLYVLSGMLQPQSGEVLYRGKSLSSFSDKQWRKFRCLSTGFIFQNSQLLEGLSPLDNITLPLEIGGYSTSKARKIAKKGMEEMGIAGKEKQDTPSLSGGEKQRVALLRATLGGAEILFCDEPTGALDEANGRKVMKWLKEQSKKRLVILVSHNLPLAKEYCDTFLCLEEGRILPYEGKPERLEEMPLKTRHSKANWQRKLVFLHFKEDGWKNGIALVSAFIGFTSLLLFSGYYAGHEKALEEALGSSLSYLSAKITQKEVVDVPGSPLSLVKETRPKRQEAEEYLSSKGHYEVANDYSFFLPESYAFQLNGVDSSPCFFSPTHDLSLRILGENCLLEGEHPSSFSFSSVLVNEAFAKQYPHCLEQRITFHVDLSLSYQSVEEAVALDYDFEIAGIVKEFSFMSTPRVYYSHQGMEQKMQETFLESISYRLGERTSIYDLCQKEGSSYYQSTSLLLFALDQESASLFPTLKKRWKEENERMDLSSFSLQTRESFLALSSAFSASLSLFVGMAFLGLVLILGMSSYSGFADRKRETALLFALGAKRRDVLSIYGRESVAVGILGALFAAILSPVLAKGFNRYLMGKFGMETLVRIPFFSFLGIPYLLVISLFLMAVILPLVSTIIPLQFSKKCDLKEELCDE